MSAKVQINRSTYIQFWKTVPGTRIVAHFMVSGLNFVMNSQINKLSYKNRLSTNVDVDGAMGLGLARLDEPPGRRHRTAPRRPTPTPPTLIFCCLQLPPQSAQLLSFSMRNQRTYSAFYVTQWRLPASLKLQQTSASIYFCNVLYLVSQRNKNTSAV